METDRAYGPLRRPWMVIAFVILLLASILGLLMRYMIIGPFPLVYKHVLHAHSHTAILGFGFIFITGSFLFYLFRESIRSTAYRRLLRALLVTTLAMAASFIYQGYGAISITVSTIMLILSYIFAHRFLKDYKKAGKSKGNVLIPLSVFWFLLSTLPLWAMGPVMVAFSKTHPLYFLTIQLFLHLQFNGWFTFALLGLIISYYEQQGFSFTLSRKGLFLLILSLFLTFFLAVASSIEKSIFLYLNSAGVVLQAAAFYLILKPALPFLLHKPKNPAWPDLIFKAGLICLFLKVFLQLILVIPEAAVASYTIRNFIVGFIHLIMLGAITLTTAGILLKSKILPENVVAKWGWLGLLITFTFTELMIFSQALMTWIGGSAIPYYSNILFWASVFFPISITFILGGWYIKKVSVPTIPESKATAPSGHDLRETHNMPNPSRQF